MSEATTEATTEAAREATTGATTGAATGAATVKVTLVRSLIGVKKDQRATVRALGLKKTGDSRDVKDTPDVRGMIHKVSYLLTVESSQGRS